MKRMRKSLALLAIVLAAGQAAAADMRFPPPATPAGCVEIVPLALLVSLILAQAPPTLPPT